MYVMLFIYLAESISKHRNGMRCGWISHTMTQCFHIRVETPATCWNIFRRTALDIRSTACSLRVAKQLQSTYLLYSETHNIICLVDTKACIAYCFPFRKFSGIEEEIVKNQGQMMSMDWASWNQLEQVLDSQKWYTKLHSYQLC